ANRYPREEVDRSLGGDLALSSSLQDGVAAFPKLRWNDRLHRNPHPLVLGLQTPPTPVARGLRIVGPAEPLRSGVLNHPVNRRAAPGCSRAGPETLLVEQSGDSLASPVLLEEFVDEPADRGLLWVGNELPSLPVVAVGRRPSRRLPEFGPNWNGCGYAGC